MYIDFVIRKTFVLHNPEKTSDISRRRHWLPRIMTSEEQAESHADDVSLPRFCAWLHETNYQPIGSPAQMWTVTRHQCGISALVSKTSFRRGTSGGVAKYQLFSQGSSTLLLMLLLFCIFFKFGVLNVTTVLVQSRNVIPAATSPKFSTALRQWIDATWEKLRKKNQKINWT